MLHFRFEAERHYSKKWKHAIFGEQKKPEIGKLDKFTRLIEYPGKQETLCPEQNDKTGVILAFGQSNSANEGEYFFKSQFPKNTYNYVNGKCYLMGSPLLGPNGLRGEFLTPMADNLITDKVFENVVIIGSGIGATAISRWQHDGDLNEMLLETVRDASKHYKITDIVWHQGESDFINRTSEKVYRTAFLSMVNDLRNSGVSAKFHIAVATRCTEPDWYPENPTALAQRSLPDGKEIFLGVDSDKTLAAIDRRDGCHFSKSGQLKVAKSYSQSIKSAHSSK